MKAPDESHPKVALISSGLGRTLRGIETWMAELALHLPAELNVELWSGGPPPPSGIRTARCLRAVHRDAPILRRLSWHRRYLWEQLSALPLAASWLFWHKIDLVYGGDPVLCWHLKRLRKWHRAKVVFMNGMRLSARWAKEFDGVHLLAPAYLEVAGRELPGTNLDHFFVVPHFVNVDAFKPANAQERLGSRRRFGLPEEAFVILNVGPVGRISNKRLEFLIEAVATLGTDFFLVSAGVEEEGAEEIRTQARQSLGPRVCFLGRVEREEIPALYGAADVFALASLIEPFSIAILEALASGLPVVHHPDEIRRWQVNGGGVAVSMTEKEAVGVTLSRLKLNPAWRQELGEAGRKLALSRYRPDHVCRQLAEALSRIHQRRPAR